LWQQGITEEENIPISEESTDLGFSAFPCGIYEIHPVEIYFSQYFLKSDGSGVLVEDRRRSHLLPTKNFVFSARKNDNILLFREKIIKELGFRVKIQSYTTYWGRIIACRHLTFW
jgi:hypothetical protein